VLKTETIWLQFLKLYEKNDRGSKSDEIKKTDEIKKPTGFQKGAILCIKLMKPLQSPERY
jgi:hypothetical protein